MNAEQYIEERINVQIEHHSSKARSYKSKYETLQVLTIVASAAIPILSIFHEWKIAPVGTAILGAANLCLLSICRMKKYQELWLTYRGVSEALEREKILFKTKTEPYNSDDENSFHSLVLNAEQICIGAKTNWEMIYKRNPGTEERLSG